MKAVILAGGLGTRLSEETVRVPKPMVEIGGRPILWHIMKYYASFGIVDFVVCLGYRGFVIKEYFANYSLHMSDVTFDLARNRIEVHRRDAEAWRVTLVDTGEATQTGGRLKRVEPYVADEDAFCFTYGDGLADVDIAGSIDFHRAQGVLATVTAVTPPGRFGALDVDPSNRNRANSFTEKPAEDGTTINGGFFVLSPGAIDSIEGDETVWERAPLSALAEAGQLAVFHHSGFWQPMDTLRERQVLEDLWASGSAPWRRW